MAEYIVERVSSQPPREWDGPNGKVFYIKTKLRGHDKAVSIGKKSADALKEGDTVYGTITPDPSHDEDKFKAEAPAFNGGGGRAAAPRGTTPEDKESIARAVALKASVDLYASNPDSKQGITEQVVLDTANIFLAWLKNEAPQSDEPQYVEEGF
jgi:hypothetical protein